MIYPKFLKLGDTIGICAPSKGIDPEDTSFDTSINHLKDEGYNIVETENVRTGKSPSSDAIIRAKEFNELMRRDDIDFIYCASGGDFLIEVLPYIDDQTIKEKIASGKTKWFAGYSDPTSLLFYLTTKYDIATLYGTNAGSFGHINLHKSHKDALSIIKGEIPVQESFPKCQRLSWQELVLNGEKDMILNTDVKWITPNGDFDVEGRLIGGCIDCFVFLQGTKYDYAKEFIEKYKDDGILWYFDNFGLSVEDLYAELWTLREAGWFKYAKGFVFGRTLMESTREGRNYVDEIVRALGNDVPIIVDADLGHVKPVFSLINGSIGHFKSSNGKGSFTMRLQ
jgi:muramoyltetrapeptide carboxypeptidase LdcA involved in peptidoglycan recycling